jgi:hypothetical protein
MESRVSRLSTPELRHLVVASTPQAVPYPDHPSRRKICIRESRHSSLLYIPLLGLSPDAVHVYDHDISTSLSHNSGPNYSTNLLVLMRYPMFRSQTRRCPLSTSYGDLLINPTRTWYKSLSASPMLWRRVKVTETRTRPSAHYWTEFHVGMTG